jgi:TolA-binding protein
MRRYVAVLRKGRGLASVSAARELSLSEAQNSFSQGDYRDTLASLPPGSDPGTLSLRAISEFHLGRKGEAYQSADRALAAAHKGALSDDRLENLADILMDRGSAEKNFSRQESDIRRVQALLSADSERLDYAAADALWLQKKNQEAAKAYEETLGKFPQGPRADRARYHLAMCYLALGKRDDAVKQLTQVSGSGQSVWADSARQELELIGWEKKYSSVLRTLPPSGLGIEN